MTKLSYDIVGKGRPIVLLHGAMSNRRVFGYQLLGLSQEHRVIAPDLPGYGQSAFDPGRPWLAQAVDGVVELIEDLGAEAPVIVGWSLGGIVAREVADRVPGSQLVLVGTAAGGVSDAIRASMEKRLLGDFPRFARNLIRGFTSSGVSSDTEDWLFAMALDTGVNVHVASLIRTDTPLALPLPAGSVVVVGARDQIVPAGATPSASDDVREVVFSRSGHAPFVEEGEKFNALITEVAGA